MSDSSASRVPLGPFDLLSILGHGAMGQVWLARHRASGRPVAVKMLTREGLSEPACAAAIELEARAIASMDHPNIVRVYDQGTVSGALARAAGGALPAGTPWIAMELAAGPTLSRVGATLQWPATFAALMDLLGALAHAHARGILHRDIKAGNVLFRVRPPATGRCPEVGLPGTLKLTDFGMGASLDKPEAALSGGTPSYMAPEQFALRAVELGPWTDLYSLGCLGWRLITGALPFGSGSWLDLQRRHAQEPLPAFNPRFEVPPGVEGWLRRLMQKRPEDRFRWAADAAHALASIAVGHPPQEPQTDPGDWVQRVALDAAPLPESWRRPQAESEPELRDAGLALFGVRDLPLVGRSSERYALWHALSEVHRERRARVVLLRGASGVGKSRLAEWLARRAHEVGGATVLRVACADEADGVAALTRQALGPGSRDERLARASRALGGADDLLARVRALALVEMASPTPGAEARSATERAALLGRWLSRLAVARPMVICLDDAHLDLDLLRLVYQLLQSRDRLPVAALFVLTAPDEGLSERQAEAEGFTALESAEGSWSFRIQPLPDLERRALLQALLPLEPGFAAQLAERTAGNPLFAVHLVRGMAQRGQLRPGPSGYTLPVGDYAAMPRAVGEVWSARVDRLLAGRAAWQGPLEIGAALGLVVDAREWAAACRAEGAEPPLDLISALAGAGLAHVNVQPAYWHWAFAHGMLRESVLARAAESGQLARHHRACADALAALEATGPPSSAGGFDARRGRHLLRAGDAESAVPLLLRASERSRRRYAPRTTARLLDDLDHALDAVQAEANDGRRGRAMLLRAMVTRANGDIETADRVTSLLVSQARAFGWRALLIDALLERCVVERRRGDLPASRAAAREAAEVAGAVGFIGRRRKALMQLASCALIEGSPADARRLLEAAGEGEDELDASTLQRALLASNLAIQAGDGPAAQRALEAGDAAAEALDSNYGRAELAMRRGELARHYGDPATAEQFYRYSESLHEATGHRNALIARANLGLALFEQGRIGAARQVMTALLTVSSDRVVSTIAHLGLLACAAGGEDQRAWVTHLEPVERWLQGGGADPDIARILEGAAALASAAGRRDRAETARRLAASIVGS